MMDFDHHDQKNFSATRENKRSAKNLRAQAEINWVKFLCESTA